MSYNGDDKLMLTGEASTIIGFHHFARILENRVAGIEVEFEVQAIRGGIQEKGRMNKIIRPYLEKMRAIEQLIRDMSNRISKMSEQDQLEYALKLRNQYTSLTTATINKLKLELQNVKDPERYDTLRSQLLNVTTLEMLTDEGAEVEGAINVSKTKKVEKIADLMNATATNLISGETNVIELSNQYIDSLVKRRLSEDVFKLLAASAGREDVFDQKFGDLIESYYSDNLEDAQDNLKTKFVQNKAFDYFAGTVVSEKLFKFYEKQIDAWKEFAIQFSQENGL